MNFPQKPAIESLSEAERASLSTQVQAVMIGLVDEDRQLRLTIAQLEEQLRRNSRHSWPPPSQDKAVQKPVQEERVCPARRRGGQPGHVGHGRAQQPVEAVDEVVVHRPVACQACGALLLGYDGPPHRHQITDVPLGKVTVTEHQAHTVVCPCCGTTNRGTFPPEVAASQFGPTLVSLLGVLMGCYRLSKRQVAEFLDSCFGVSVATSSGVNQPQVVRAALAQPVEELQA